MLAEQLLGMAIAIVVIMVAAFARRGHRQERPRPVRRVDSAPVQVEQVEKIERPQPVTRIEVVVRPCECESKQRGWQTIWLSRKNLGDQDIGLD